MGKRTSTSHSNCHLGHYTPLLIADGKHKKDGNEEIINTI